MAPFNLDTDLADADWVKQTWDLPLTKTEFRRWWQHQDMTAAEFKRLPVYGAKDRPTWVDEVLDDQGLHVPEPTAP